MILGGAIKPNENSYEKELARELKKEFPSLPDFQREIVEFMASYPDFILNNDQFLGEGSKSKEESIVISQVIGYKKSLICTIGSKLERKFDDFIISKNKDCVIGVSPYNKRLMDKYRSVLGQSLNDLINDKIKEILGNFDISYSKLKFAEINLKERILLVSYGVSYILSRAF